MCTIYATIQRSCVETETCRYLVTAGWREVAHCGHCPDYGKMKKYCDIYQGVYESNVKMRALQYIN